MNDSTAYAYFLCDGDGSEGLEYFQYESSQFHLLLTFISLVLACLLLSFSNIIFTSRHKKTLGISKQYTIMLVAASWLSFFHFMSKIPIWMTNFVPCTNFLHTFQGNVFYEVFYFLADESIYFSFALYNICILHRFQKLTMFETTSTTTRKFIVYSCLFIYTMFTYIFPVVVLEPVYLYLNLTPSTWNRQVKLTI